jgi:hypothetical protein
MLLRATRGNVRFSWEFVVWAAWVHRQECLCYQKHFQCGLVGNIYAASAATHLKISVVSISL